MELDAILETWKNMENLNIICSLAFKKPEIFKSNFQISNETHTHTKKKEKCKTIITDRWLDSIKCIKECLDWRKIEYFWHFFLKK